MLRKPIQPLRSAEFVALMAALMSITALAIDSMLPAFPAIEAEFGVDEQRTSLIISLIFTGIALGSLVFGPLADSIGRKPVVYIGVGLFTLGALLSVQSQDFFWMLVGRFIQGLGLASARTITITMARDLYSGREMAQVTSFIMMVFIAAPAIAPSIGQGILLFFPWEGIFVFLILYGLAITAWLAIRQPETLHPEYRRAFQSEAIINGFREVLSSRVVVGNLLASGFVMANLLTYLNTAQPMMGELYGLGEAFPIYFGALAILSAASNFVNAKIVKTFGMRFLSTSAIIVWLISSLIFLVILLFTQGVPPLWMFLLYAALGFGMLGFVFGNINALSMEPMGHIAGVAASIIGCLSTLLGVAVSIIITSFYNDTVYPLTIGYSLTLPLALYAIYWGNADKYKAEVVNKPE